MPQHGALGIGGLRPDRPEAREVGVEQDGLVQDDLADVAGTSQSRRLCRGPIRDSRLITMLSRTGSMAGFVTCAKRWTK